MPKPMRKILLILACACTLCACHRNNPTEHHEGDIAILRADQLFFGTPASQLPQALAQARPTYQCAVFSIPVDDPNFTSMVTEYTQSPDMRMLYDTVQAHFASLTWLERELTPAVQRLQKAYKDNPQAPLECKKVIAYLNGSFDYRQRTFASEGSLLISLDQYVLPYMEKYGFCGQPMYIVNQSDSIFLLTDCLTALAQQVIPVGEMKQMLDFMVAEGKTLYMLDIACPKMDDRLKMRYTEEQMEWMKKNEQNVWAYLVQHKLLFESDQTKYHNFIDDAPKTNAFGEASAPRTAQYIGWQMVRQYASKTGCSLQELLNETNANTILNKSGYRP